jgi:hypothetical protein
MATQKQSAKPKVRKHATKAQREPVNPENVRLVQGKGSKGRGGSPGGSYWHIYVGEERAGYVFINVIDETPFGKHASIQISVNAKHRNRQIGRVAYRLACEQSEHDEVVAHMRKSNLASKRAAEEAGFKVIEDASIPQLALIWRREPSNGHDSATTLSS